MMVTGFRTEFCFKRNLSLREVVELFRCYTLINGVSEGTEIDQYVSVTGYKQFIQFVYMKCKDLGRGRSNSEPSLSRKAYLVELLNCLGYFP